MKLACKYVQRITVRLVFLTMIIDVLLAIYECRRIIDVL